MTESQRVSLIIPVFNEGSHLRTFFDKLLAIPFAFEPEYVVIDDCSTDESWKIVEEYAAKHNFITFKQPENRGKGAALREGISRATAPIIAIQDADFEYDPHDLNQLVVPIMQDRADVVYGSRFRKTSPQVHRTFHYLVNRILTMFSNILSGLYLTDMETCYKVFRSEIIKPLSKQFTSNRFGFEPEVTAAIARLKLRVHEYPISYFPRGYFEGKKITWRDGIAAIRHIIYYNTRHIAEDVLQNIPTKYHLTDGRLL